MGYTTSFSGEFLLDRPLAPEHAAYLRQFARTRRMKRDPKKAAKLPDPLREAVGLPIGHEGAYYVGADRYENGFGDDSVVDGNRPPGMPSHQRGTPFEAILVEEQEARDRGAQPGLWCQWIPSDDGSSIVWDEGEKFYEYGDWLVYLIKNFLQPWGYIVNGRVDWQGESSDDVGAIFVRDNEVRAVQAEITLNDPFVS